MTTKKQFQDQLKKYIYISNDVDENKKPIEVEYVLVGITFAKFKKEKPLSFLSIQLNLFWGFYSDVYPNYEKMLAKSDSNNWGHSVILSYFKSEGVLK